ncbi:MAG TPA: bifunctional UDP-N-acetylglucosamine diphosphorylase/glucosamine-1-phosphate N-acetyltransferase GlmU [Acetobacteraceae bacterium]|nr:bifunctional UDP-N-acetylglucosamine diphosphorylase/glucosamine-1-phosphate N-acetyltransferase GlmU [Acetobacteraceae bacterium]
MQAKPHPSHPEATAVILAAGLGTRMKSALPKAAHKLAGRPMLQHLLATCEALFGRIVVVVGPDMESLAKLAAPHAVRVQAERLGTAHAALAAADAFGDGDVAVLFADNPLISSETLRTLLDTRRDSAAGLALMAMRPADPARYGRLVMENGVVARIVEWADATPAERNITLCNAGALCGPAARLLGWLRDIRNDNAKGEYYLTDLVALARRDGERVVAVEAPEAELRGINSRAELAAAEAEIQSRLRMAAMDAGATLIAPETVFFAWDTALAPDTVVEPHVVFGPGVSVESGAQIRAFTHLEGCHVGAGAIVGPYARLRPGAVLGENAHVGNFVELKAATLGAGAKANHLAYIGDASVGPGSNIGAGTITCNYDGFEKHRTEIGARVFVGSDSVLVAPVRLGDGSFIAAGSVITKDVPPDALAFGRARQSEIPSGAARFRAGKAKG